MTDELQKEQTDLVPYDGPFDKVALVSADLKTDPDTVFVKKGGSLDVAVESNQPATSRRQ